MSVHFLLSFLLLSLPAGIDAEGSCQLTRTLDEQIRGEVAAGSLHVHLDAQPGVKIKKAVAIGYLDAPVATVYGVVSDDAGFAEMLPYVERSTVRLEAGERIVRQHLDLPFPLTDRHYELRVDRHVDVDCAESRWRYIQGSGNIDDTFGRWEVLADERGGSWLAYAVWVDPGGMIPAWAQNWASKRALPRVMAAVRTEVSRRLEPSR